jgi:hypothetical protein
MVVMMVEVMEVAMRVGLRGSEPWRHGQEPRRIWDKCEGRRREVRLMRLMEGMRRMAMRTGGKWKWGGRDHPWHGRKREAMSREREREREWKRRKRCRVRRMMTMTLMMMMVMVGIIRRSAVVLRGNPFPFPFPFLTSSVNQVPLLAMRLVPLPRLHPLR